MRRLLDRVGGAVSKVQVSWNLRWLDAQGLTVLDIDNTLADTWPTLTRPWPSERARLRAVEPLAGMKAAAYDTAVARGDRILFLSHRNWWEWPLTLRWLRRAGFGAAPSSLVLVSDAADKLAHLRRCVAVAVGGVTYWDDLSHSHEHGEAVFYEGVINEVRALGLTYHGYDEIAAVGSPRAD